MIARLAPLTPTGFRGTPSKEWLIFRKRLRGRMRDRDCKRIVDEHGHVDDHVDEYDRLKVCVFLHYLRKFADKKG